MSHPLRCLLLLLCLGLPFGVSAQYRQVSVGFYNTENLFDTVPSPFYNDREFTPDGAKGWDTERYRRKLANLARVIDDGGFDLIALAEVENEAVIRDLVASLDDAYCYIHRSSSDRRGIDRLIVAGDLNGELSEPPLRQAFDYRRDGTLDGGHLHDALHATGIRGGSYCWNGRWLTYDHILVSQALHTGDGLRLRSGGIFIRDYLLDRSPNRTNFPRRTFSGNRYVGGYSDHLPVFIVLERLFAN